VYSLCASIPITDPTNARKEVYIMALLDLQGLEAPGGHGGGGGGSTVTVVGCESQTPSNLSLALCH
jgi:lanthionine-containing peptide SapB